MNALAFTLLSQSANAENIICVKEFAYGSPKFFPHFHSRQDKEFRLTRDCFQFNSPADKLKSGGTHREN